MSFYSLIISFIQVTAEESSIIVGGSNNSAVEESAEAAGEMAAGGLFEGGLLQVIIMYAALFGALYFFMFRPNRKKEKQLVEMRDSIRPGDNIVTNSGLFGKVIDVGLDAFVIEFGTNRGVRIPVAKTEVAGIRVPKLTPQPQAVEAKDEVAEKGKEKKKWWGGKNEG